MDLASKDSRKRKGRGVSGVSKILCLGRPPSRSDAATGSPHGCGDVASPVRPKEGSALAYTGMVRVIAATREPTTRNRSSRPSDSHAVVRAAGSGRLR